MKITIQKENAESVLKIALEGSLDTVTAPELESRLTALLVDGVTELIFDFSAVDYVSSAGLRVIMWADLQMSERGKMTLKNVCEDVREVFEMTGFDELLTFE